MNYQLHYDRLIQTRKFRERLEGQYYEKHHILPRSMGGDDSEDNLIYLTAREHFLAHWLLWRIHRNRKMACAFAYLRGSFMSKGMIVNSSRAYEEARKTMNNTKCSTETREKMSINWNRSEERSDKISKNNLRLHSEKRIGMHGKQHSESYKKSMSEKMKGNLNAKGYIFTEEQRQNLSNSLKGKKLGKPLSEQHKLSIKNANYRRWVKIYGQEEADRRKKDSEASLDGSKINKKYKYFIFYKDGIEIYRANNKKEAIDYCKISNLPYSTLVFKFSKWNDWECVSKFKKHKHD